MPGEDFSDVQTSVQIDREIARESRDLDARVADAAIFEHVQLQNDCALLAEAARSQSKVAA